MREVLWFAETWVWSVVGGCLFASRRFRELVNAVREIEEFHFSNTKFDAQKCKLRDHAAAHRALDYQNQSQQP